MHKRLIFLGIVCLMLVFSSVASAQIEKIQLIFEMGMTSSFDADGGAGGDGKQSIISTNGAWVFFDDPYEDPAQFSNTDARGIFESVTDNSSGGVASGMFDGGTVYVKLYDGSSNLVLEIAGTVDWYDEDETTSNSVDGRGIFTRTTTFLDEDYWGTGVTWGSSSSQSGVTTSLTGAVQNFGPLVNYQTDWYSPNVTMFIYADSSAIPEPATIMLIGLGSLFMLKNKKRA